MDEHHKTQATQKPELEFEYWDRYALAAAEAVHEPMVGERAINAIHLAVQRIGLGSAVNALASAESRGLLWFRNGMWCRRSSVLEPVKSFARAKPTYRNYGQ